MPPSQIAAFPAFYIVGVTKLYIVDTLSNFASPTRGELDGAASLDVTRQVKGMDGWSYNTETIERPDISKKFTPIIGGRQKAADSSLLIWTPKSGTGDAARTKLVLDYLGYVVIMPGGDVTGYKMDVWPVQVTGRPKQLQDSDPFHIQYTFGITDAPAEDVAIP